MFSFLPGNRIGKSSQEQEQCLRINLKEDPSCLDPRRARNLSGASQIQAMLFEGLMRLEPDGTLSCAQASSYEISADRKTYLFRLKETFWSDGTPVVAADFVETWKSILSPSFPSCDAYPFFCIKHAEAVKKGVLLPDQLGIYARDSKTLIVELEHPNLYFLHLTASTVFFPVNRMKDRFFPEWYLEATEHFVSNGPFKLVLWKHHEEMLLEKNTFYHRANEVKLELIYITMIQSGIATLHIHESGLFDITGLPLSPLPVDLCRELAQKNLLTIKRAPGTAVCMFNTKRFPFNNINMRKAFSYGLNRQHMIDTITLLEEEPAFDLLPPFLNKNKATPYFKDQDIAFARACFQKGLKELEITPSHLEKKIRFSFWKQDHGCPLLPQALQERWLEHLGIEVQLEALDFQELHDQAKKGLFSMGYFVLLALHRADNGLELFERFKDEHYPRNYSRWENKTYTDLLNRSMQSSSEEESIVLFDEARKILMEELPFVPLFYWNFGLLVQPHVKGLEISPLGYLHFDRVFIEKNHTHKSTVLGKI
jgi:oligopeptide transport system substrate-binding protein